MLLDLGLMVAGEEIQSIYSWSRMIDPAHTRRSCRTGRG